MKSSGDPELDALVAPAREGDGEALEVLIRGVQGRVYNLALRMLWHPEDAEDATQEILIRVVTNLGAFEGRSAFTTWVYRIAANHLLTTRKRRAEREELTFEEFGAQLDRGLDLQAGPPAPDRIEEELLVEEVKIGCLHGMLLCLDREHRLAYILGEIFELDGPTGAEVLGISHAAFRKRLSRARDRLHAFLRRKCGLTDPSNPCRCHRRVDHAEAIGRVDPDKLLFAEGPVGEVPEPLAERALWRVERMREAAAVMQSNPEFATREDLARGIRETIQRVGGADAAHRSSRDPPV